MNVINKLTIRHLKENKRRTLVTIIGVIISVAMLTAVATIGVSFVDLMKRETIARGGEWHVEYQNINSEQLSLIEQDDVTKDLIISNDRGYAVLENSENTEKPYLFIKEYSSEGLERFPIALTSGRLPRAEKEIVISDTIADNANVTYQIGDQLTIDVGKRSYDLEDRELLQDDSLRRNEDNEISEQLDNTETETYEIVGTIARPEWEPYWSPGYTVISYLDEELLTPTDTVNASVVLNKINRSLYQHAENFADQHNIEHENIRYNSELLRYYGVTGNDGLQATMYSLVGIIMAVIIVGAVSLIYNAFAISVSERSRHLGMLSSVGATKKQKRNSVFFEGAVIGAMSIPVGIVAGLVGMAITFHFINTLIGDALYTTQRLEVVVTPVSILVACSVSIVTIFISTYLPARKAAKISAIDAIRQTQDVKLSKKTVKTSKLVRKIFGLEAEIGLKNLKRNKRRYQATVFSLIISIVLFLTVTFFTSSLEKGLELTQANYNYDIQIFSSDEISELDVDVFANLSHVTESSSIEEYYFSTSIDQSDIAQSLKESVESDEEALQDGKYNYSINLVALDDESFQAYAKEINFDPNAQENATAIVIDKSIHYNGSGKIIEEKSIYTEPGERLSLHPDNHEIEEEQDVSEIEIGTLTDHVPMGINLASPGTLIAIVSNNMIDDLITEDLKSDGNHYLYMNSSDPMVTQEAIDDVKESSMHVYNVYQRRQEDQQLILLLSVFIYGFITLISLISIANIFNTISTSISLRKREFAMLRSVGMTPKGFNKMINYESIFYGIKALIYGLPISVGVMFLIYWSMQETFEYSFMLPWMGILFVIVMIFIIVSAAMLYSSGKIKKENIIDGLKQENI
ncbi:ABC transporter permease [Amphibacillus jilinensis]|uniref:ABC transporter permease n=1 Tax=Amphibacillus jilinensis TaxID=1216008 RepID=UPI0002D58664|nr:ABC transporter permease [Amphibacillus jilinensis]